VATATAFPNYSVLAMTNQKKNHTLRVQNIRLENFAQLSIIQSPVKAVKLSSRGEDKPRGDFGQV